MLTTRGHHAHRRTVVGAFVNLLIIRQGDRLYAESVCVWSVSKTNTDSYPFLCHSWVRRDNGASDLVSWAIWNKKHCLVLLPPPFSFKDALKEEDGRRSHGRGHHGKRKRERVFLPPDERVMFNFDSTFLTHHHTVFSLVLICHAQTVRTPTYAQNVWFSPKQINFSLQRQLTLAIHPRPMNIHLQHVFLSVSILTDSQQPGITAHLALPW